MNYSKIRIGRARIVIIFGSYAYRIARFRIVDLILRLIRLEYEIIKFGNKFAFRDFGHFKRIQLAKDMLWAGLSINRKEYQYWKKHAQNLPLMFTFFYIINIQERDDMAKNLPEKNLLEHLPEYCEHCQLAN